MKIDVTKIEGYADMTAEQKLQALESYEYDDMSGEVSRLKNSITKSNADAAEWKRKYQDTLSDEQKRQAEMDDIRQKLADAEKREQKNRYIAQYVALGASHEVADSLAEAYMSQNPNFFVTLQNFLAERDKGVQASLMANNPKPAGGNQTPVRMTREQIMSITDTAERQKAIAENLDLFG